MHVTTHVSKSICLSNSTVKVIVAFLKMFPKHLYKTDGKDPKRR